jgi:hypothetical protein
MLRNAKPDDRKRGGMLDDRPFLVLILVAAVLCFVVLFFSGEKERRALASTHDLSAPSRTIPASCESMHVKKFPKFLEVLEKDIGHDGGQWSACTHLHIYGINFELFLARALTDGE